MTLVMTAAIILYTEEYVKILGSYFALCFITYMVPPVGWLRPHRYSDIPSNRVGYGRY